MPFIASVGTALPPYEVGQAESKNFARQLFQDSFGDVERLLKVFESTRIEKRHFCMPPEWFAEEHSWEEKNNLFIENAICLGAEAISACLRKQDLKAADIDVMVYVNSTGIATPSIDAYLANLLGMKADLVRMPLWGLGCAGGAAGLARGFDLALAHPHRKIIVCCIELCGLTFVFNDRSKANFIAASLFADGAAAALIIGDEVMMNNETMPQILSSASFTWPDTLEVMGWHVQNEGMMVIFQRYPVFSAALSSSPGGELCAVPKSFAGRYFPLYRASGWHESNGGLRRGFGACTGRVGFSQRSIKKSWQYVFLHYLLYPGKRAGEAASTGGIRLNAGFGAGLFL